MDACISLEIENEDEEKIKNRKGRKDDDEEAPSAAFLKCVHT